MTATGLKECLDRLQRIFHVSEADKQITADIWKDLFVDISDETMREVTELVIRHCRQWPVPADVIPFVDIVREQRRAERIAAEKRRYAPLRLSEMPPRFRDIIRRMERGETKELVNEIDISAAFAWARKRWPQIDGELVRRNYPEVLQAMDCEAICQTCRYPAVCSISYAQIQLSLEASGWMKMTYQRCAKAPALKRLDLDSPRIKGRRKGQKEVYYE